MIGSQVRSNRRMIHFDYFRSAYNGEENETKEKGDKVTIEDLLSNIQASEQVRLLE